MTRETILTRLDGDFVLNLLEQVEPVVAGEVLEEMSTHAGRALIDLDALIPNGAARAMMMVGDDGAKFVDLDWLPDRNTYAYFDAADGVVIPDARSQALFRLDLSWWLIWLATALGLTNAGRPTELIRGQAWDIGDLWITRRRKASVLFVRRLHLEEVALALRDALARREGRSGGIVLTSTRHPVATIAWPGAYHISPILDVVTADDTSFVIDADLLKSPYLGNIGTSAAKASIHLSPDNRTLTIHGEILTFRGEVQPKIIRQLVDAITRGDRLRTKVVLENAKSSADSLAKAFHNSPNWEKLKTVLHQESGSCWLDG